MPRSSAAVRVCKIEIAFYCQLAADCLLLSSDHIFCSHSSSREFAHCKGE